MVPDKMEIDVCLCMQILLFLIVQHSKIAGELWLFDKMDDWCENHFLPLIDNDAILTDKGLYS